MHVDEWMLGPDALAACLAGAAARTEDMVLVLSREGIVRYANAPARALTGDPLEGQCLVEVVDVFTRDDLQAALGKVAEGASVRLVLRVANPPLELDAVLTASGEGSRDVVMQARRRALEPALASRLEELNRRYLGKVRELASLTGRLREAAVTDSLTNLFNRRAFLDRADAEWVRAHRHGTPLCVVVFDLDHFKQINDRYGHPAGDEVLKHFAMLLRTTVRASDIPARIGGEEFVALLPHTDVHGGLLLADRLRTRLADHVFDIVPGAAVRVTISAGLAQSENHRGFAEMLADADAALYQAKAEGRDCVRVAPARRSIGAA